jgi:hypothetical protein
MPCSPSFGHGAAENHVFDFSGVEARGACAGFADGDGGEVIGASGAESAFVGFADGGTDGTDDDGVSHKSPSDFNLTY